MNLEAPDFDSIFEEDEVDDGFLRKRERREKLKFVATVVLVVAFLGTGLYLGLNYILSQRETLIKQASVNEIQSSTVEAPESKGEGGFDDLTEVAKVLKEAKPVEDRVISVSQDGGKWVAGNGSTLAYGELTTDAPGSCSVSRAGDFCFAGAFMSVDKKPAVDVFFVNDAVFNPMFRHLKDFTPIEVPGVSHAFTFTVANDKPKVGLLLLVNDDGSGWLLKGHTANVSVDKAQVKVNE